MLRICIRGLVVAATLVGALAIGLLGRGASASDSESGEIWVTSQGTHRLFILHGRRGRSGIETVTLPSGTGPHITTFSPGGDYAYVSEMGNGNLVILRAHDRQIASSLNLGPALTHQAKPSPDGATLLVTQIGAKKLIKVSADEEAESWRKVAELTLEQGADLHDLPRRRRARLRLPPAERDRGVDVATMSLVKILPTDGFVACGMVKSHHGKRITLASAGGGGHIYRLNTATDQLDQDLGTLGAADWQASP